MENDYAKLKTNMEAFIALYETALQSGLLDGEKKFFVEAVLYFAKQSLQHAINSENAKKYNRPKEEIENIDKKFAYCWLAATVINSKL